MPQKISKGSFFRHTFYVAIATVLIGTIISFLFDLINRIFHSNFDMNLVDIFTAIIMFILIITVEIIQYIKYGNRKAWLKNKLYDTIFDLTIGALTIILITCVF